MDNDKVQSVVWGGLIEEDWRRKLLELGGEYIWMGYLCR